LLTTFPDFDSRTRPWFIKAVEKQTETWSDVYILSTGQDLAIAASKPIYNSQNELVGVTSVDIFLSHLDNFLKGLQIGQTGQSFIMERSGYLLATSEGERMYTTEGQINRVYGQESENSVIRASTQYLQQEFGDLYNISGEVQTQLTIDRKSYYLEVLPFQDDYGIDWLIVIAVPRSDFLAQNIGNTHYTMTVTGFAFLIVTILNIFTGRWVIKPLYNLISATKALTAGDWDKSIPVNENWVQEIFDLTLAFNQMSVRLKELLNKLKLEIVERSIAQEALRSSEAELKKSQQFAHVGNWIWHVKTDKSTLSDEMYRIIGLENGSGEKDFTEVIDTVVHPDDLDKVKGGLQSLVQGEIPLPIEFRVVRPDGTERIVSAEASEIQRDESGAPIIITGIIIDITDRKQAEEKLLFMATHDSLTNLPNRDLFNDRLNHAIAMARRNDRKLAVLFIDLDNFKSVNDAFGHKQGDWLLRLITQRLLNCVRESDTIARIGGDEFIVLLENITDIEDTLPIAEKIIQTVAEPFKLENSEVFITSSIGISLFPNDGEDSEALLTNADRAMYKSKDEGKNNFSYYSAAMHTEVLERLELRNQLRQAIDNNELELHYQPTIDFCSEKIVTVEALLRWNHPERGLLQPGQFIVLAEESGLILPITEWVLNTACRQMKTWIDEGIPPLRVAVNFSGRDLNRTDMVSTIKGILDKTGLQPGLLTLEFTENIIFQRFTRAQEILEELKSIGVNLSIDDFGSGYSTLSQLANFSFDSLKIDRHFSENIVNSEKDRAIVSGIITIARNLGLDIIVEGVETEEQLKIYTEFGCSQHQGWYFSKALPVNEVEPLIRKGTLPFQKP